MKILIVTQYYWPENSKVTDIAESLQKAGNEVTVLTGLPNYPQGYIYEGYRKGENRVQEHNNVRILRVRLIERRHNVFYRFLNYYSFSFFASKFVKKINDDFDVVLAMEESPIMLVRPAIRYSKKHKKPLIMYEMDLWPESLLAGGIKSKSPIFKHYRRVSANIYSRCDRILVSTKEHIEYIRGLPKCKNLSIDYLAQYAETVFEESNFESVNNGVIDLMFAGNIGIAQSIDTIINAAALLKDDPRFMFHIVGSGSELSKIQKLASRLMTNNVIFYGQRALADMPELYRLADAMLVTLENKAYANMTIPGKVQSYMSSGKPIIGAVNGSCGNFIKNNDVGYCCSAENSGELADLIRKLDYDSLRKIGEKSKEVYFKKYSKEIFMKKLIFELKKLA